jgi:hypothetical protein
MARAVFDYKKSHKLLTFKKDIYKSTNICYTYLWQKYSLKESKNEIQIHQALCSDSGNTDNNIQLAHIRVRGSAHKLFQNL